jgi:hypothetical protein
VPQTRRHVVLSRRSPGLLVACWTLATTAACAPAKYCPDLAAECRRCQNEISRQVCESIVKDNDRTGCVASLEHFKDCR